MSVHEKVNILMVDDQPGKLLSYEAILADLGENLIKATSAKDALEKLLKTDVAVVLMDVSMPEIDGFELAEIIRQHPRFQKTAIIFVSAVHLTDLDRLKGYQHGAVDYLSVPIVPEVLRAKVRVFAELHRKKLQLERLNSELEQRVADRTLELELKAVALQQLNGDLPRRIRNWMRSCIPLPTSFSAGKRTARGTTSAADFTNTPARHRVQRSGFGWLEYLHPDDRERSLAHWMRCVQSGEAYESEYRLRGVDRQYRWFRARAVPLRDPEGGIIKWYGTCSDIHDSKLLEQSIRDNAIELERMVDIRTAELRRLSSRLMTMQDEERRRIAREIHDGLGQELAAAKMILDGILSKDSSPAMRQASADASQLVDRAIKQVRTISHLLHPPLLDEVGLVSALRWYLEGTFGAERNRDSPGGRSSRSRPAQAGTGNRDLPHHPGSADQHVPAFRSAQREREPGGKRRSHLVVTVRDDGKGIEEQVIQLRPGQRRRRHRRNAATRQ